MIEITYDALDPAAITDRVRVRSAGAVITFLGTTRDATADRDVLYLEYEAYEPMAEKKLTEVAEEMMDRWPLTGVAISHRLGRLEITDISLVVAVSSQHRGHAFEAGQYGVDRLKQIVPIWKKEYFRGGEVWVESPEDVALRERTRNA